MRETRRDWYYFLMGTIAGMLMSICMYTLSIIVRGN